MSADPKRPKRYKASANEWEWFRTWFATERCWVCDGEWTDLHHIIPRSSGGDDDIVNLAPLCRQDHDRIEARDPVARALLRGALMPSNLEHLRYKLGERAEGWLERHYPSAKAAA